MKEVLEYKGLLELNSWMTKEAYHFWAFTDFDVDITDKMQEISGSLEFDILGE